MTTDLKLLKEIMFRSNLHGCAWGWRHRRSIVAISVGWKLTGVWKTNPSLTTGSLSRINSGWGFLYEHQKHAAAHLLTFTVFPFLWSKTKIIALWTHHNTLSLSIQFLSVSFRNRRSWRQLGFVCEPVNIHLLKGAGGCVFFFLFPERFNIASPDLE